MALDCEAGAPPAPEQAEPSLRRAFPAHALTLLCTRWHGGEVALVSAQEAAAIPAGPGEGGPPRSLPRGGISGRESGLRALLQEGARRGAAVAIVSAAREPSAAGAEALLAPVLAEGFDLARPLYARPATEGLLQTGVVYPLTRVLYGARLRQPMGGEACLSAQLARRLVDDADWRRDPEHAGSDAWLVAKALAGRHRVCQVWMGPFPRGPSDGEDARHALARVLGPVFRELERHAVRWQRVDGSAPTPTFGEPLALPAEPPPEASVARLVDTFRLGQRDLGRLWGLVLPPATLLALRAAARAPDAAFRLDDALWARVVYDFAVGWHVKAMERSQLLASFTPLYLGWAASFLHEAARLDPAAAEARVEALCGAFEREKRYLIGRWRWPDGFTP